MTRISSEVPFHKLYDNEKIARAEVIVYQSDEDKCWVAHSLHTDQIGTGDCLLDSLIDLATALKGLAELSEADIRIKTRREAPSKIQNMAKTATPLPGEIASIASKIAWGEWPKEMGVNLGPKRKSWVFHI